MTTRQKAARTKAPPAKKGKTTVAREVFSHTEETEIQEMETGQTHISSGPQQTPAVTSELTDSHSKFPYVNTATMPPTLAGKQQSTYVNTPVMSPDFNTWLLGKTPAMNPQFAPQYMPTSSRDFHNNTDLDARVQQIIAHSATNVAKETLSPLYEQTILTYEAGVSVGTAANRKRQSELYLKFCIMYNVQYLSPPIINILMFIQFLKNSFDSHVSVKNYVSGARTWVLQHKGITDSFDSFEVKQMFGALEATSTHIPVPAYPLTISDVKIVCDYIDANNRIPLAVKPCVLIGYTCFLRSCNLLSPSTQKWLGPHTLLVSDIRKMVYWST